MNGSKLCWRSTAPSIRRVDEINRFVNSDAGAWHEVELLSRAGCKSRLPSSTTGLSVAGCFANPACSVDLLAAGCIAASVRRKFPCD